MTHTRLFDADAIIPQRAGLYRRKDGTLLNGVYMEPSVARGGDGGLVSTAADLAKWDIALDGDTLLSAESRREMWEKAALKDGTRVPYGFGWEIRSVAGHAWILHSGSRPGAEAVVSRFPDDGLAVILLTNLDHANAAGMSRGIAGLCVPALALPAYLPIEDTEPQIRALVSALIANAATDHPRSTRRGCWPWSRRTGALRVTASLALVQYTTWRWSSARRTRNRGAFCIATDWSARKQAYFF